jgi:hypothetical protein
MGVSGSSFLMGLSSSVRRCIGVGALVGSALLPGCTLITDVNREDIPEPVLPTFPEVDAGQIPDPPVEDAGVPDSSAPSEPEPLDAGRDAGGSIPDAGDAAP